MNSRRHLVASVLAAIGVLFLVTSATAQNSVHGVHRLPGSWHVVIQNVDLGSLPALFTFTSDGTMIGTESPGPFESPAFGSWAPRGGGVAFTVFALLGSPAGMGTNTGKLKVVGSLHYDRGSDSWSGDFSLFFIPPVAGANPIPAGIGHLTLTRIEVE